MCLLKVALDTNPACNEKDSTGSIQRGIRGWEIKYPQRDLAEVSSETFHLSLLGFPSRATKVVPMLKQVLDVDMKLPFVILSHTRIEHLVLCPNSTRLIDKR